MSRLNSATGRAKTERQKRRVRRAKKLARTQLTEPTRGPR